MNYLIVLKTKLVMCITCL